jgi:hypothetical protein
MWVPVMNVEAAFRIAKSVSLTQFFSQNLARRLYSTVTAVFLTFLLRAVFCLFNGIGSLGFKDRNVSCDDCDLECMNNVYVVMAKYLYVPALPKRV